MSASFSNSSGVYELPAPIMLIFIFVLLPNLLQELFAVNNINLIAGKPKILYILCGDHMSFIMAIDQGGTKTDIIIADSTGNILGTGNDRGLFVENRSLWNPPKRERRPARMVRIRYAAEKALAAAGLKFTDITSVSACCIGADWEFEYETGKNNLRSTLGINDVSLYNDCIGALRGGSEIKGKDCAVICLGTGANCAVISREGREYIYAYYMKDIHQGAGAIGRFIFQAVFDAESGLGPQTLLKEMLLEKTGSKSVDDLFMAITTGRTETEMPYEPVYQDYCPLLFRAVKAGDTAAVNYLDWLCRELARYVITTVRRFEMQDREINIVFSGGVPKGGAVMGDLLEKYLGEELPRINCRSARFEPSAGALLLEYDRIYPEKIPDTVLNKFEKGCAQFNLFRLPGDPVSDR